MPEPKTNPNAPLIAFQQRLDKDSQLASRQTEMDHVSSHGMGLSASMELGVCGAGNFHRAAAPALDELDEMGGFDE